MRYGSSCAEKDVDQACPTTKSHCIHRYLQGTFYLKIMYPLKNTLAKENNIS